ncbi:MAG TPA: SIMPL domain-containing protein [Campylobacterales bacterium]|nr:SIMPL domain-containing protein [Campylobacterales bacterium]
MMQEKSVSSSFVLGVLIAAGLIGMSFFISEAVLKVKSMERSVSVKGLAQKHVKADTAIFPIRFQNVAPTMDELSQKMKIDLAEIKAFLHELGFENKEITISAPQFNDRLSQSYNNYNPKVRYSADSLVTVYSKKVDLVVKLQRELYLLTEKGVFARNDQYETKYMFTGLNTIKPEMIEIATKNARATASKFAKDSHSKLGKIEHASQGYFSINDRDPSTPYIKEVRVVTNISYYLND